MDRVSVALAVVVAATLFVSMCVVAVLDRSGRQWGDLLRDRFVMGVPWGTLVVIAFVSGVYLFVQDGITDFSRPITIPYRAWSYLYPLGMVTAPFAHASPSHLTSNLTGTLVVAPLAEYAWGHYPRERGSQSFANWRSNPWIRAFVGFPLAAIVLGLVTSAFSVGPVIGFSGVVFAFAGFAIVRYPITTLVAVVGAQGAAYTVYRALVAPVLEATAQPSPPSPPWWATIAIQGHALGFFLGVVLGIAIVHRRGYRPDPFRVWIAVLLFGFAKALWAIYWFRGEDTYVLFRAPGVVIVMVLSLVITLAIASSDRPLLPVASDDPACGPRAASAFDRIRHLVTGTYSSDPSHVRAPSRRHSAVLAVVFVVAAISGPAIPVNLFSVGDDPAGTNATVTVEDYSLTYAEDVENELVSVVDVDAFGENTTVQTSGVIVSSADRNIWTAAVSKRHLAFQGRATVEVGGPGWRRSVTAIREGWSVTGNDTAYQVWLRSDGEERRHAFESEPVQADLRIDGNNVTVVPADGEFFLVVDDGETVTRTDVPSDGETVEANGVRFVRDGKDIVAVADDTIVQIASEERYKGR